MAVITISRQFGSGGREVAARVCELLGYRYFDKTLIGQVAAEMGWLKNEAVDFSEEHYKGKSFMEQLFRPGPYVVAELPAWTQDPGGEEVQFIKRLDKLEFGNLIRGVILGAYDRGNIYWLRVKSYVFWHFFLWKKCQFLPLTSIVIVGRGGQALLADKPDVLHVRLEAPLANRINRVQQQYRCTAAQARALIAERDKATTKYLDEMFKVRPDDPQWYHLILNLGKWSLEAAAQIMVKAVGQLAVESELA